jgi:hypothetical protein
MSTIIDSASVVESDKTVDYFYGSDSGCIDHGFYGIYGYEIWIDSDVDHDADEDSESGSKRFRRYSESKNHLRDDKHSKILTKLISWYICCPSIIATYSSS